MIVRHTTAGTLLDAAALYVHLGRRIAIQTIRARCESVGVDPATGIKLYDLEGAEESRADVKPRYPHRRPRRTGEAT